MKDEEEGDNRGDKKIKRTSANSTNSPKPPVRFFISLSILTFQSSATLSNSASESFPPPVSVPVVGFRRPREAVGREEGLSASVWNSDISLT